MHADLRSDTVTLPVEGMRAAMAAAEVGDDVFGEDPTVNRLQATIAALLNKEAALFVPSGTMANQICLSVLARPGEEVICEQGAHIINFESGAMARLSLVQPKPLPGDRGVFTVEQVREAVRPGHYYYPRTAVIAIENTHNLAGGTLFPLDEIERIAGFARENGLRMHLDGARLWNASVATGIALEDYARSFDSVSLCFSKGLGAPVGSVVAGSADFIEQAHLRRKQFGGGMRQAGVLAAAALYAVENHFQRLEEDHANARLFAEIVSQSPALRVDLDTVQTNIVIMDLVNGGSAEDLCTRLRDRGVWLVPMGQSKLRAVTHLNIDRDDVIRAAELVTETLQKQ